MKKRLLWLLTWFLLLPGQLLAESPLPAPDFNLPTQMDGTITLSELKGHVVYLDFWASWCGPCRKSFPWLNKLQQKYAASDFKVVAINLDSEKKLAERFLSKIPAHFTVAFDPDGKTAETYKLVGMPSSYLINREGRVVMSHVGFLERDKAPIEQRLQQLIGQ